jgi:hypothetical protein
VNQKAPSAKVAGAFNRIWNGRCIHALLEERYPALIRSFQSSRRRRRISGEKANGTKANLQHRRWNV